MSLLRKIRALSLIVIISIILSIGLNHIYADEVYPLEAGEKLIEETIIDRNHAEIYTQHNEDYFVKKLQRAEGQWVVESTIAMNPKWTGLKTDKIDKKGDRKLAAALENELKSYGLEAASLPPVIDYSYSEFLPPVGDQGMENSCAGWAAGYYLRTYQQAQDIGWKVKESGIGIESHIFSPSFIYNQINNGVDNGASIEKAGRLITDMGAAALEDFPYIAGDYLTQPGPDVIQSAYPHRIRDWRLLYSDIDTDQYIIQKTKEYLLTGDVVLAGSRVGLKFQYPYFDRNGNSIITREYYPSYLHAFVIVGYDDNFINPDGIGAFKLVNSWGVEWGNDGFSYISYEAFAANAIEGFVFTDLVNAEPLVLETDINDVVTFSIDFSGTGRYDIKVKNTSEQIVYEEDNLRGHEGINSIVWYGNDMSGSKASDGAYKLSIIPYKGNMPKLSFELPFTKSGKAESASALAYINNNGVQYVDIPITFKSDGIMSIKVEYNGAETEIISNQAVHGGESNTYTIYKRDFDFNNIDLNQVKIKIDIQ